MKLSLDLDSTYKSGYEIKFDDFISPIDFHDKIKNTLELAKFSQQKVEARLKPLKEVIKLWYKKYNLICQKIIVNLSNNVQKRCYLFFDDFTRMTSEAM